MLIKMKWLPTLLLSYRISISKPIWMRLLLRVAESTWKGILFSKKSGILWLDYNPIGSILFSVYSNFYNEGDFWIYAFVRSFLAAVNGWLASFMYYCPPGEWIWVYSDKFHKICIHCRFYGWFYWFAILGRAD